MHAKRDRAEAKEAAKESAKAADRKVRAALGLNLTNHSPPHLRRKRG